MLKKLFGTKPPKRVKITGTTQDFPVTKNQTVLEAALSLGIPYPHDCTVGTCGTCRSRLVSGRVDAITPFGYTLSKEELDGGFILACQALAESDLELDVTLEEGAEPLECDARIHSIEELTHDIKKVTWKTDQAIEFKAGQYMNVTWPGSAAHRSYSFSNAPTGGGEQFVSTFIRKVPGGTFTEKLFAGEFDADTQFRIDAPHGTFWLREGDGPILLVGGGSGLSPLMSLLEHALANGVRRDVVLLFGGREQRDIYCLEELRRIAETWLGRFEFWPVLSEEEVADIRHGMVTHAIADAIEFLGGSKGLQAYMCGPPPMIDAGVAMLSEYGVGIGEIYYDKFTDASTIVR